MKTVINRSHACAPWGAKTPATFDSDRDAVEAALSCIGLTRGKARVVTIKKTLHLGEVQVSAAYFDECAVGPISPP